MISGLLVVVAATTCPADGWARIRSTGTFPTEELAGIAATRNGVWVAGSGRAFWRHDGNQWRRLVEAGSQALWAADARGETGWAAGDDGIVLRADPTGTRRLQAGTTRLRQIVLDGAGIPWVAGDRVYRIEGDAAVEERTAAGLLEPFLVRAGEKVLVGGKRGKRLVLDERDVSGGLSFVTATGADATSSWLVGGGPLGDMVAARWGRQGLEDVADLWRVRLRHVQPFEEQEGPPLHDGTAIQPGRSGVWVANGGLFRRQRGAWRWRPLPKATLRALAWDGETFWAAGADGFVARRCRP